jgi:class 3 adenylate cyclase
MADDGIPGLVPATRAGCVAREYFANSAHLPVVLALYAVCTRPGWGLLTDPCLIPALAAGFVQAFVVGSRTWRGLPTGVWGDLLGPLLFAPAVFVVDPAAFLARPEPLLYALFALILACLRTIREHADGLAADALLVAAGVVRALVPLSVYLLIERMHSGSISLAEPSHAFLAAASLLLGLILGAAQAAGRREHAQLVAVAGQLREYSELLLGRTMLARALGGERELVPTRAQRTVVFADIRGFTRWSEPRPPEEVLAMLNGLYEAAEHACAPFHPVRTKFTADEILVYFPDPLDGARAALALRDAAGAFLAPYGLHVGIGMHHGPVIEGLLGARRTKAYDILGDVVNTAKRICDLATAGKIIVSFACYEASRGQLVVSTGQQASAKGKSSVLIIAELIGVAGQPPATGHEHPTPTPGVS